MQKKRELSSRFYFSCANYLAVGVTVSTSICAGITITTRGNWDTNAGTLWSTFRKTDLSVRASVGFAIGCVRITPGNTNLIFAVGSSWNTNMTIHTRLDRQY